MFFLSYPRSTTSVSHLCVKLASVSSKSDVSGPKCGVSLPPLTSFILLIVSRMSIDDRLPDCRIAYRSPPWTRSFSASPAARHYSKNTIYCTEKNHIRVIARREPKVYARY